jgi:hypothetical protein
MSSRVQILVVEGRSTVRAAGSDREEKSAAADSERLRVALLRGSGSLIVGVLGCRN